MQSNKFYVITDAFQKEKYDFITGFWSGTPDHPLVADIERSEKFITREDAETVVKKGDFFDPVVYEMKKTGSGALEVQERFDMAYEHGRAGKRFENE